MYTCTVCNKSFVDKNTYKMHQKTHIVDKTYHCPKCNKIFFKEVCLLTHQCTGTVFSKKAVSSKSSQKSASLSNSKRYKCSKCNASFNSFQSKNSHMRVHMESSHTTVSICIFDVKLFLPIFRYSTYLKIRFFNCLHRYESKI